MQTTAAVADRTIAPPPGARVGSEFVGLARQLRQRISEAEASYDEVVEKWIGPLRPRPFFVAMPRHKYLKALADNWPKLPSYGRLGLINEFSKGRLHIVEIRCSTTMINNLPDWETEGSEPGLWLAMHSYTIQPPDFRESILPLALIGLHSLARRYQRGTRDNRKVLIDLVPIAHYYRTMSDKLVEKAVAAQTQRDIARLGDFEIPVTDGKWLGSLVLASDQPVLAVRTFVDV